MKSSEAKSMNKKSSPDGINIADYVDPNSPTLSERSDRGRENEPESLSNQNDLPEASSSEGSTSSKSSSSSSDESDSDDSDVQKHFNADSSKSARISDAIERTKTSRAKAVDLRTGPNISEDTSTVQNRSSESRVKSDDTSTNTVKNYNTMDVVSHDCPGQITPENDTKVENNTNSGCAVTGGSIDSKIDDFSKVQSYPSTTSATSDNALNVTNDTISDKCMDTKKEDTTETRSESVVDEASQSIDQDARANGIADMPVVAHKSDGKKSKTSKKAKGPTSKFVTPLKIVLERIMATRNHKPENHADDIEDTNNDKSSEPAVNSQTRDMTVLDPKEDDKIVSKAASKSYDDVSATKSQKKKSKKTKRKRSHDEKEVPSVKKPKREKRETIVMPEEQELFSDPVILKQNRKHAVVSSITSAPLDIEANLMPPPLSPPLLRQTACQPVRLLRTSISTQKQQMKLPVHNNAAVRPSGKTISFMKTLKATSDSEDDTCKNENCEKEFAKLLCDYDRSTKKVDVLQKNCDDLEKMLRMTKTDLSYWRRQARENEADIERLNKILDEINSLSANSSDRDSSCDRSTSGRGTTSELDETASSSVLNSPGITDFLRKKYKGNLDYDISDEKATTLVRGCLAKNKDKALNSIVRAFFELLFDIYKVRHCHCSGRKSCEGRPPLNINKKVYIYDICEQAGFGGKSFIDRINKAMSQILSDARRKFGDMYKKDEFQAELDQYEDDEKQSVLRNQRRLGKFYN